MDNKLELGTLFRSRREEKGLLVRQVAAVTEVDQAIISRIENGDRLPTRDQAQKLAALYDLDIKKILTFWLAEKIIREYGDEPFSPDAFRQASNELQFRITKKDPDNS